jgi:hypothetical protein
MVQSKAGDRPHLPPQCPVCHHPQTKVQRRLTAATKGATMYVCARAGQCSVGMDLNKMDTWTTV